MEELEVVKCITSLTSQLIPPHFHSPLYKFSSFIHISADAFLF